MNGIVNIGRSWFRGPGSASRHSSNTLSCIFTVVHLVHWSQSRRLILCADFFGEFLFELTRGRVSHPLSIAQGHAGFGEEQALFLKGDLDGQTWYFEASKDRFVHVPRIIAGEGVCAGTPDVFLIKTCGYSKVFILGCANLSFKVLHRLK